MTALSTLSLGTLSSDDALLRYLQEIKRFPLLSAEEEQQLAHDWVANGNPKAAHQLITSHLRLVAKIAFSYKGYGLPMPDMIAEGNLGLMQAVKGFDPNKGFRLATYAMWWIRASIQDYILRSWSLVKIGTTATQKKLFFNLRRAQNKLAQQNPEEIHDNETAQLAEDFSVSAQEVSNMAQRLHERDVSLNVPLSTDSGVESSDALSALPDLRPSPEQLVADTQEQAQRRQVLLEALSTLSEREKIIIAQRWLCEPPTTFDVLAQQMGVSRERVRQLEARALEKMRSVANLGAQTSLAL